jgi:hypothetical protein
MLSATHKERRRVMYKVMATGGNCPPDGIAYRAATLGEAVSFMDRMQREFVGSTMAVLDEKGLHIDLDWLRQEAATEEAAEREQVKSRNA